MVESLNFLCPHCGIPLSLPASAAGIEGPCPRCRTILIAPTPWRNERILPATSAADHEIETGFRPFVEQESQQAPMRVAEPELRSTPPGKATEPPLPDHAGQSAPRSTALPQALILLCSILITAAISLAAGYLLGLRSGTQDSRFSLKSPILASPAASETDDSTTPVLSGGNQVTSPEEPEAAETAPQPELPPTQPPPPTPLETAEAALKSFLDAPDWASRTPFILEADKARSSQPPPAPTLADGPIDYLSVSPHGSPGSDANPADPLTFQIITSTHPRGFPVRMYPTADGWQLDWQMFLELRDDLFRSFTDGPADKSGTFHLLVSLPPPERAARTENEHFSSFLIAPPLPERQQLAYVNKTSAAHATLRDATTGGLEFPAVLEVAKRSTPDGKTYLEISSVVARDWTPQCIRK